MPEIPPTYVLRYRDTATGIEWDGSGMGWYQMLNHIRYRQRWGFTRPIGVRRVA